jgi:hypothetical protein
MMKKFVTLVMFAVMTAAFGFGQISSDEWFKKAGEYLNSGDYANAVTAYSEAIKRDSSLRNAYWFRGFAYYRIKNYDAALADCNTVINGSPDFPLAYVVRGDAYGAKGIYHKAVVDYRTGLEKGFEPSGFDVDTSSKASMWFCGAMYMEIVVNRFLGNSAAVANYENRLQTVCDKNKVTRAEVETFYRQNIGALISTTVDAEFKKTRGGYVPYNVYVDSGKGDAIVEIKENITQFFINPNTNTYAAIYTVTAHFNGLISRGFSFAGYARDAYDAVIKSLSPALLGKMQGLVQ